jgi:hypothetical protein
MQTRVIACLGLASVAVLFACSDAAGPAADGTVTVKFAVTAAQPAAVSGVAAAPAALPVDGTNGSLNIDGIWLVVDEFKLERVEDACEEVAEEDTEIDDDDVEDDDCEEIELPPFFVAVPLEQDENEEDGVGRVSASVAPGSYEELKFETKAADEDSQLLAEIRADPDFADWPAEASMLVVGTFTPTEGDPVSFRAYFDAEVKVELEFSEGEPLVVEEGDNPTVEVFVDPAIWFENDDDSVDDLSEYDYAPPEYRVFKFEAKFADGFTKIELDDD